MAAPSGRRCQNVNFSEYLLNLNVVPPQEPSPPVDPNLDDELAMFTNTNFSDWDPAPPTNITAPLKVDTQTDRGPHTATTVPAEDTAATTPVDLDLNFGMSEDLSNFDFGFASSGPTNFGDSIGNFQPLQPNPAPVYQAGTQHNQYGVAAPNGGKAANAVGHRRQISLEEQSRVAAEEDKRRRNTAASARFRVKKKAREQALEKREKELNDEVNAMKSRITQLETENKWLRGLVMEKTGDKDDPKTQKRLAAFLKSVGDSESDSDEPAQKKAKSMTEKAK